MQVYETTFIVNPQIDEADISRHVKNVADLIAKSGGKIVHEDHLGTRRLAYEIKGLSQGYYGNFIYEAPADFPQSLERHFKLEEAYLRYLTIRFEGNLEKIEEDKASAEKVIAYTRGNKRPDSGRRPERHDTNPVKKEATPKPVDASAKSDEPKPAPADAEQELTTEPTSVETTPEEVSAPSEGSEPAAAPIADEQPKEGSNTDDADDEL